MNLNSDSIITFKEPLEEGYTPTVSNTIRVEDLINQLELLPEIRMMKQNIASIVDSTGVLKGGSISIKLNVEYNPEEI